MPLSRHWYKGRRPGRIAILDRVDDAPRFIGGFGTPRAAAPGSCRARSSVRASADRAAPLHEAPDQRTGAVTADDIASGRLREFSSCEVLVADADMITAFVECEGITAQPQIDGSETAIPHGGPSRIRADRNGSVMPTLEPDASRLMSNNSLPSALTWRMLRLTESRAAVVRRGPLSGRAACPRHQALPRAADDKPTARAQARQRGGRSFPTGSQVRRDGHSR